MAGLGRGMPGTAPGRPGTPEVRPTIGRGPPGRPGSWPGRGGRVVPMPWEGANGLLPGRGVPPPGRRPAAPGSPPVDPGRGRGAPGRGASRFSPVRAAGAEGTELVGPVAGAELDGAELEAAVVCRGSGRGTWVRLVGAGTTPVLPFPPCEARMSGPWAPSARPVSVRAASGRAATPLPLVGGAELGAVLEAAVLEAAGVDAVGPAGVAAGAAVRVAFAGWLAASFSCRRRTTGASTVEEAERTNSPMSLSVLRTVLLSTPSALASS